MMLSSRNNQEQASCKLIVGTIRLTNNKRVNPARKAEIKEW